jgi:hypothetical protein
MGPVGRLTSRRSTVGSLRSRWGAVGCVATGRGRGAVRRLTSRWSTVGSLTSGGCAVGCLASGGCAVGRWTLRRRAVLGCTRRGSSVSWRRAGGRTRRPVGRRRRRRRSTVRLGSRRIGAGSWGSRRWRRGTLRCVAEMGATAGTGCRTFRHDLTALWTVHPLSSDPNPRNVHGRRWVPDNKGGA